MGESDTEEANAEGVDRNTGDSLENANERLSKRLCREVSADSSVGVGDDDREVVRQAKEEG